MTASHIDVQVTSLYESATAFSCAIAATITLFAPALVSLVFGNSYDEAALVLRLHVWSVVFIYLGIVQTIWDICENRLWLNFSRTGAGAIVNIVLNLLLIPRCGPLGAACATVIAYSFASFLFNAVIPDTRRIFMIQLRALIVVPLVIEHRHKVRQMFFENILHWRADNPAP